MRQSELAHTGGALLPSPRVAACCPQKKKDRTGALALLAPLHLDGYLAFLLEETGART